MHDLLTYQLLLSRLVIVPYRPIQLSHKLIQIHLPIHLLADRAQGSAAGMIPRLEGKGQNYDRKINKRYTCTLYIESKVYAYIVYSVYI